MIGLVGAVAGGALLGWLAGRRHQPQAVRGDAGTGMLPDPALRWLMRAHGGLGVWVSELLEGEEGPSTERVVDAEQLSVDQITAVDRRLERARDAEQNGAERMDGGTMVFRAADGIAVALLLPDGHVPQQIAQAEDDLGRLLEGVRRRPQMVALAQAQSNEASLETVGSVGLRLAYQLERVSGCDVIVAAVEPPDVRVVGASGGADRRLHDAIALPESTLARVARGGDQERGDADFMGGAVADRRQRAQSVLVLPIRSGRNPVGAVALWLPDGREPAHATLVEVGEAIRNAAPRIERALESDSRIRDASVDPLTGLANRRAFEAAMGQHGLERGALVYADFDRFKQLNDTLGHAAGDAALVHFARLLREQIRKGDLGARIGGEEFAVWLPNAPLAAGARLAERVRLSLSTTSWSWQGRAWPLTASFGVAAFPETSRRIENLPAQADSALYVAKNAGRDRVEVAAARPGGADA